MVLRVVVLALLARSLSSLSRLLSPLRLQAVLAAVVDEVEGLVVAAALQLLAVALVVVAVVRPASECLNVFQYELSLLCRII